MPFKTFVDDEVLYASDVNRYWVQQHSVIKLADQSRSSVTTTTDDNELIVPVIANQQYYVEFFLICGAPSNTPDLKMMFAAPAGSTFDWSHGGLGTSATGSVGSVSRNYRTLSDVGTIGLLSSDTVVPGYGRLVTGNNPGNFRLQWSQNTSSTDATTIRANSVLIVQRLTT